MCLVKRNHTYYFRRRYPVDVAELIESHEICRSLKTKVRSEALSRASQLEALFEVMCERVRSMSMRDLERDDVAILVAKFKNIKFAAVERELIDPEGINRSPEEHVFYLS